MAALLMIVWLLNGVAQAGGWPPSVMIMARWFSAEERGRTMGVLGTSYQIGSAIAILACGWLASTYAGKWQIVFLVPAAALALSAVHTWLRLTPSPPNATELSAPRASTSASRSIASTLSLTLGNPRLWLLALGLFGLDLVRFGFLDWAPTHLKEVHGAGGTTAALKVAVFPLAGAAGALVSGWLTDRFFQSRRAPVIAIMLALVGLLTFVYDRVISFGSAPTVVCLALIGFFLYGAQILLVGTAAQDFAKLGTAAAAAGFVDFAGSMGAFAGDVVTGSMVKAQNWRGAIHVWGGAAIVGALLVATLWRAKPQRATAS
jgi:OPA family glycerol-3-phosphate transporter-like MFS transporter